jgi:hypothetical protein
MGFDYRRRVEPPCVAVCRFTTALHHVSLLELDSSSAQSLHSYADGAVRERHTGIWGWKDGETLIESNENKNNRKVQVPPPMHVSHLKESIIKSCTQPV